MDIQNFHSIVFGVDNLSQQFHARGSESLTTDLFPGHRQLAGQNHRISQKGCLPKKLILITFADYPEITGGGVQVIDVKVIVNIESFKAYGKIN